MELTVSRLNMKCSFCHATEATRIIYIDIKHQKEACNVCDECYNETMKQRAKQLKDAMNKRSMAARKAWKTRR